MEKQKELPDHIAIIMDGNRRWAKQNKLITKQGHKAGAETLKDITSYANKIGIKYLTVYAFSTENWKRSEDEVNALMMLLGSYLIDVMEKNNENVKICFIGDLSVLSDNLQKNIRDVENKTKNNTGLQLNVALNYGGRNEITNAIKNIAIDVKTGNIDKDDIDEELIAKYLYTKNIPDPDVVVRTSGELRTSNFLPWQIVYSEFIFFDKYWPEFNESDIDYIIDTYNQRNRKLGGN